MVEEAQAYLLHTGAVTEESLRTFRPSVVNRLDRNTSGILAVGKDLAGAQELSRLFKERSLHKYYYCLVKGRVEEKARIKGYLVKNEATNRVTVEKEPMGREALPIETEYIPVDSDGEVTLLKVLLVTGRTHQIRAHLSSVGHPILGDHKYGDPVFNARAKEEYHLTHQLLHAAILTFPKLEGTLDYLSGRTFQAPLPKKFARILTQRKLRVEGNAERGTAGKEEAICRHGIPEA